MYTIYQIMSGDTIDSIANKFGTNRESIERLNGVISIQPGGYLIVPISSVSKPKTYTVEKGDNMYQIAKKFDVDYQLLLAYNGLEKNDYIYPGQIIELPSEEEKIYFTTDGDTLSNIAENFNTTVDGLLKKNPEIFLLPKQIIHY